MVYSYSWYTLSLSVILDQSVSYCSWQYWLYWLIIKSNNNTDIARLLNFFGWKSDKNHFLFRRYTDTCLKHVILWFSLLVFIINIIFSSLMQLACRLTNRIYTECEQHLQQTNQTVWLEQSFLTGWMVWVSTSYTYDLKCNLS